MSDCERRAMRDGWQQVLLGDVCTLTKGRSATEKTVAGPYPLVVTAARQRTSSEYQFDGEAVCIPTISSLGHGRAALHRVHYAVGRFALANLLVAAEPRDRELILARYLHLYLTVHKDRLIVPLMRGTANVNLHPRDLERVPIDLPPLRVQRRVVDLVDSAERFTHLVDAQTIATHDARRATAGSIFDRYDAAHRLAEVVSVPITYGVVKPGFDDPEGIGLVRSTDVGEFGIDVSRLRRITPEVDRKFARTRLVGGEVLIALVGQPGSVAIAEPELAGCNLARQVGLIRCNERIVPEFLFEFLCSPQGSNALQRLVKGAVQQVINLSDLRELRVPLPSPPEQHDIAATLGSFRAVEQASSRMRDASASAADAILRTLVSGEHEIPESYDELMTSAVA